MTYNKMIKNKVERDGYDSRDLSSQSVSETPRGGCHVSQSHFPVS